MESNLSGNLIKFTEARKSLAYEVWSLKILLISTEFKQTGSQHKGFKVNFKILEKQVALVSLVNKLQGCVTATENIQKK